MNCNNNKRQQPYYCYKRYAETVTFQGYVCLVHTDTYSYLVPLFICMASTGNVIPAWTLARNISPVCTLVWILKVVNTTGQSGRVCTLEYQGTKPGCFGHTRVGTREPNLVVWSYSGRYPRANPGCFGQTRVGTHPPEYHTRYPGIGPTKHNLAWARNVFLGTRRVSY